MYKTHKQYWFRSHELKIGTESSQRDYDEHHRADRDAKRTELAITEALAELEGWIAIVKVHLGKMASVDEALARIESFKPRKASTFKDVLISTKLEEAEAVEEAALAVEYGAYDIQLNRIVEAVGAKVQPFLEE